MDRIAVFTDGSYDPDSLKGSWAGIVLWDGNRETLTGLKDNTSQHEMELLAISEALQFIWKHINPINEIVVYTDSEYVKNLEKRRERLERNQFITKKGNVVKNSQLIQHFFTQMDELPLEIIRTPSHQKRGLSEVSDYNREVDKLARKILRKEIRNL